MISFKLLSLPNKYIISCHYINNSFLHTLKMTSEFKRPLIKRSFPFATFWRSDEVKYYGILKHSQKSLVVWLDSPSSSPSKIRLILWTVSLKHMILLVTLFHNKNTYLTVREGHCKMSIFALRWRHIWIYHWCCYCWLALIPKCVLTKDKVGEIRWQSSCFFYFYLRRQNRCCHEYDCFFFNCKLKTNSQEEVLKDSKDVPI